jgi:hypothetical protein
MAHIRITLVSLTGLFLALGCALPAEDGEPVQYEDDEQVAETSDELKRVGTKPPAGCMGTYQGSCRCDGDIWYDSGSYYCTIDQEKCGDWFQCWCSCPVTE